MRLSARDLAENPSFGTSPPLNAYHGQRYSYIADATNGVVWELRWYAPGRYWACIGGPPLLAYIDTDETFTSDGAWHDPATVGPSVVVPRAGDYVPVASCGLYNSVTTGPVQYIGVTVGSGSPANNLRQSIGTPNTNTGLFIGTGPNGPLTCAAGDSVRVRYASTGGQGRVFQRSLAVIPRKLT